MVAGCAAALTLIGIRVRRAGPVWPDLEITETVQSFAPGLDGTMRRMSDVGGIVGMAVIGGAVSLTLLKQRRVRDAVLVAATGSAELLTFAIRLATERPRPTQALVRVLESGPGTSFPSGHAADAAALGLVIAHVVTPRGARRGVLIGALWALAIGSGVSRVYLGAHWPSDVVGGYLTGTVVGLAIGSFAEPTEK